MTTTTQNEPLLGLASTRELLEELAVRMEVTQNSTAGRDLGDLCRTAMAKLDRGVLDYRIVQPAPTCTAKIRPFTDDTEVHCGLDIGAHRRHQSPLRDYAYPGSLTVITWTEDDRRNFRGEWRPCAKTAGCVLPDAHHGNCAL